MTTPDVPYRLEISVEVPGTPEQVWAAIATADGISSWFMPTDLEERQGGAMVAHMGGTDVPANVTGWDPPRRFVYEEPEWAAMMGHPGAEATPMASEFLIEARSGGTCVVRVVSSAFGTGAEWEREFMDEMEAFWAPYFRHQLRMYLGRFPGQRASMMEVEVDLPGGTGAVREAIARALGIEEAGQPVDVLGLRGHVEDFGEPYIMLSSTDPVPGYANLFATGAEGSTDDEPRSTAHLQAWLFGDDAPAYVDEATPLWKAWFAQLAVADSPRTPR
jgi:uncharacterized protein YndB with AHSA1/START domain